MNNIVNDDLRIIIKMSKFLIFLLEKAYRKIIIYYNKLMLSYD